MYAENGLMFSYFPQDVQQFDDFCCSQKPNASLDTASSFVQTSDYNFGEEGDLFKAPEPVIQEPFMGLDPMGLDPISAAISMISCGEDVISPQSLTVSDIESSIESGQLLSEVFYECRKDLLAKDGNETPFSEVMDIKIPTLKTDEELVAEGPFGKSTLGNGDISVAQSSMGLPKSISSCTSEERREKLSRYWNKKSKRNFGRKIKYACRKALADSQPRIRGRFARTEEK
ncbi:zinc finger protein constans-like 2 [Phtheirospermum japonicum]|uniref:Zinc finger protein constans-like 2 n=1 Tax=Phtheirospermum japonicum TaxID=374723 RepID=A0A830CAN3_9LAMI|nr:zinc finger protein constans-like 2 [Phtheirospermum japonicum]